MLVIRLARTGRHKYPTYRIVAADQARAATGKFVSVLGHYNPHTKELAVKTAETAKFLEQGAQPSNTVIKLLQREQIKLPAWAKLKTKHKPAKKAELVEQSAPPAVSAAEPAADTEEVAAAGAVAATEQAQAVAEQAPDINVDQPAE
jgi:small subunit ribosomal protein S16